MDDDVTNGNVTYQQMDPISYEESKSFLEEYEGGYKN